MAAIDKAFNMTSSSDAVKMQDLPFDQNVQPLDIRDSPVQKFQKAMKQHSPNTGDAKTCGTVARS